MNKNNLIVLAKNLNNRNILLKDFIEKTKDEIKKHFSKIKTLPFLNSETIKVTEIETSIKIYKIVNKDILEKKMEDTCIKYSTFYEIFENHKYNKIVVQGHPGMGKTVHVNYLFYTWAIGKWGTNADILILRLFLRDVQNSRSLFDEIKSQNFPNNTLISSETIEMMLASKTKKAIFFLDGADEFSLTDHPLNDYIYGGACNITTVIWCRNWQTEKILQKSKPNIIFELTGLEENLFVSFFTKCFLDKKKRLKNLLKLSLIKINR